MPDENKEYGSIQNTKQIFIIAMMMRQDLPSETVEVDEITVDNID